MSSTNAWGRGPFDARSVANRLLDEADRLNIEITNLSLQKLLYFSHGFSLLEYGEPLVAGYFEAWDHGPVHPLVYRSFKKAGRGPISFRVEGVDAMTGTPRPLPEVASPQALSLIWKVLSGYTRSSLSILLDISHARGGGPWHFVMAKAEHSPVVGMRITNDVMAKAEHSPVVEMRITNDIILERFRRHVVGVNNHDASERENEYSQDI